MSLSDSMFLFEIIVEEITSFIKCKQFSILCQFADVFKLYLKDPNDIDIDGQLRPRKKQKARGRSTKSKYVRPLRPKVTVGQTILITNTLESLIDHMKKYPLEITLCAKNYPGLKLGSTEIPWSTSYIHYLNHINNKVVLPVSVDGKYNIFDEITSKRMATINLKIKLSYLQDRFSTQFRTSAGQSQQTLLYTDFNLLPSPLIPEKKKPIFLPHETGIIKTIYAGGKKKLKRSINKKIIHKTASVEKQETISPQESKPKLDQLDTMKKRVFDNVISLVKSDISIDNNKHFPLVTTKSCSSIQRGSRMRTLDYIFGDPKNLFSNQIYYVGYFTVQKESPKSSKETIKASQSSEPSDTVREKFKFNLCEDDCPGKITSQMSLDLPLEAAPLITVKKCDRADCNNRKGREPPTPPDDRVLIDLTSARGECCDLTEKIEQVVGGMTAKMKVGNDPCYCECECTFGFTKKTTYCNVCGGYELIGDDPKHESPAAFPCPIYHKLVDKNKLKSTYSSGSDSKRRGDDSSRSAKRSATAPATGTGTADKSGESEKDNKKGKKKRKDDRFKFNYGYQGIPPHIGHSQCAMPCTGTLGAVPKHMGWLWTAEDVPGMKFRPAWRPGATNKKVVRLLRIAENPDEVHAKKRKKEPYKKPLKRPLLVVHKKDGEFTVTMETMKAYSKPRGINQHPYEDKPVVTYTIGRSEEENIVRRKKKERAARRLERDQRDFIQSAFKNMCNEICLKTYQQALGILPDTEDPECLCYPSEPGPDRTNLDVSCSCSEDSISLGSDTDSDEWIVEFTPPNALFDPTVKTKKVQKADTGTQYTYLDFRVKLLDSYGNQVPRFFKGPDGSQQCSDLGGFWSPDHKWLQINVDGIIAPDNRWAPNSFIGPNGEQVDAEDGKFQAANMKWLVLGIDGYVDCHGRWRFYPRRRAMPTQKKLTAKKGAKKGEAKPVIPVSEVPSWSCFGDASPKHLSKMGIVGHGFDRKLLLSTLKQMLSRGEDVTIPKRSEIPRRPGSKRGKKPRGKMDEADTYEDRIRCKHPVPSEKGIVAVDARGNKVYFKLKDGKNKRPNERIQNLTERGISLSSFHLPCFHSFINSEIMKQQQRERLINLSTQGRGVATHG